MDRPELLAENTRGRQVDPVVDVQPAPTLAALERIVTEAGGIERVLLSDLSLGAWRPHQLAAEWAEGLGLSPYPSHWTPRPAARAQLSFGAIAEAGIEIEALGERVVRDASELTKRLAPLLSSPGAPRWLFVMAPAPGKPWREENLVFLRFMLAALDDPRRIRLLAKEDDRSIVHFNASGSSRPDGMRLRWLCGVDAPTLQPRSVAPNGIGHLPGLVPRSLQGAFDAWDGLVVRHGAILPAPELRPVGAVAPTWYDRLRPLVSDHPWLDGFTQFAGSNFHVDAEALARHAAAAFDLGSAEIAIDYLDRAIGCATGRQRVGLQCQLQGYRIATHRFDEAARMAATPASLAAKPAAFLSMARGWGSVMSGRAAQGLADLDKAATLLGDADESFGAYLQNITALALAQLGSVDEAMALERAVETGNSGAARSWPLHYVNQINMARLHRRRGDHHQARLLFERAFATHWGGRSVNDRVYVNAVMAKLAEAEGLPAQIHWVRAALHFAAADAPESFGTRHASLLVDRQKLNCSREARVEHVAAALADKVEDGLAGDITIADVGAGPVFSERPLDPATAPAAMLLVGGDGWSVVADSRPAPPAFDGPSMRRLRRALAAWISATQGRDLGWVRTYRVDSRLGREMAASPTEAFETAARLGVGTILLPGLELRLDSRTRHEIIGRCRLRISQLVSTLTQHGECVEVRFRRCRPKVLLSDPCGLITAAQRNVCVDDVLAGGGEVCAEIARFEQAGVVWRELPAEDAAAMSRRYGSSR